MVSFCDILLVMDYKSIIAQVVGNVHVNDWFKLEPKVYYKDDKPYGLIADIDKDGIKYLSCTVSNPENAFTVGMIRDIVQHYNNGMICLITDDDDYQDLIRRSLRRYNFEFFVNDGVLFSYGGKQWE